MPNNKRDPLAANDLDGTPLPARSTRPRRNPSTPVVNPFETEYDDQQILKDLRDDAETQAGILEDLRDVVKFNVQVPKPCTYCRATKRQLRQCGSGNHHRRDPAWKLEGPLARDECTFLDQFNIDHMHIRCSACHAVWIEADANDLQKAIDDQTTRAKQATAALKRRQNER